MTAFAGIVPAAFAISALSLWWMLRRRWRWAIDHPNDRSLHSAPTPRIGGVAIIIGVVATATAATFAGLTLPVGALGLALLLAGLSLFDDRRGLPVGLRLLAHVLASGVFAAYLGGESAPWWWMVAAMFVITGSTNFFNFMDGANGLAGGMAAFGFATFAWAAADAAPGFSIACASVAAASLGFLVFNLRGQVFMGDGGSIPLGFLAASLGLEGVSRGLWAAWFPVLVFAPFAADATVTLLRRILRRERFWLAHREHYYQRLVRSGWSHGRLAAAEYLMMGACAAAALWARTHPASRWAVFAIIAGLLVTAGALIEFRWRRRDPSVAERS